MKVNQAALEFSKIWNSSNSSQEVSEKTKLTVGTVLKRASRYRKIGIELKHLPAGRPKGTWAIDVNGINAVLKKFKRIHV